MSPFLGLILKAGLAFQALATLGLVLMMVADSLPAPFGRMEYTATLCSSALGVLVGGFLAIYRLNVHREKTPDSMLRRDRLDAATIFYVMGLAGGFGIGACWGRGGEILAVIGALLALWVLADSPLSPVLILVVTGWTLVMSLWTANFWYLPAAQALQLVPLAWLMLLAAGLIKRFLTRRGPPGFLHTLVVLSVVFLVPFGLGLLGPEHDLPSSKSREETPVQMVLIWSTAVAVPLYYHWSLRRRPRPTEPTQTGCGCAFLGLAAGMALVDRLGALLAAEAPPLRLPLFLAAVLFTLYLAVTLPARARTASAAAASAEV